MVPVVDGDLAGVGRAPETADHRSLAVTNLELGGLLIKAGKLQLCLIDKYLLLKW